MNINESSLINIILCLRIHDITKIKKGKLEKILSKYKDFSLFQPVLKNTPTSLTFIFEIFESRNYIKKKENENDTYIITIDKEMALKSISSYREKSMLYEMLALLYENETQNFVSVFSDYKKDERKELTSRKQEIQSDVKKQPIKSLEEFFYLFLLLLQKKGISYLDEVVFMEAFGFSFMETESFCKMLELAYGRAFLKSDMAQTINVFLIDNPFFKTDANDLNNYVVTRIDTPYPSFAFNINPVLFKTDQLSDTIDPEDYNILDVFVEQYISVTRNKRIA